MKLSEFSFDAIFLEFWLKSTFQTSVAPKHEKWHKNQTNNQTTELSVQASHKTWDCCRKALNFEKNEEQRKWPGGLLHSFILVLWCNPCSYIGRLGSWSLHWILFLPQLFCHDPCYALSVTPWFSTGMKRQELRKMNTLENWKGLETERLHFLKCILFEQMNIDACRFFQQNNRKIQKKGPKR